MSIDNKKCDLCGREAFIFKDGNIAFCRKCDVSESVAARLSADSKKDAGKPMAGTPYEYFPRAILAVAQVATDGVAEYGRNTWASLPDGHVRRCDAFHRHLLAHASGEKIDKKRGSRTWRMRFGTSCPWSNVMRAKRKRRNNNDDN